MFELKVKEPKQNVFFPQKCQASFTSILTGIPISDRMEHLLPFYVNCVEKKRLEGTVLCT
jgi:hypothetical protein